MRVNLVLCHVCVGGGGGPVSSGHTQLQALYHTPTWVKPITPAPPSQGIRGPEEWAIPQHVNLGSVENIYLEQLSI